MSKQQMTQELNPAIDGLSLPADNISPGGAAASSGSFCQIYRVTDEALIAEIAVWPNFFLMNVFFALKGSKLFIIICCHCS